MLDPKTPGVYIEEVNAFGNSVVPVATAIPAFIGYTPHAEFEGKSYVNKAQKITSFAEFKAIYTIPNPPPPAAPTSQYSPNYSLVPQEKEPDSGEYMVINKKFYSILPDPTTIYYFYNSIRLFYQNGGGDAYIVSVGLYGEPSKKPLESPDAPLVNPNVQLDTLQKGLELLKNETEPTMYICPDATLLAESANETLMQAMLSQAEEMQTTVCIFDIIGGREPNPILYPKGIETFRNSTGSQGLKYGVSYYPFVGTTIMQPPDVNYTNLFGGAVATLKALLNEAEPSNTSLETILNEIEHPPEKPLTAQQYNAALTNSSKTYQLIMKHVLNEANLLPPSGAIAGVYAVNDSQYGVWNSPANVSMVGVVSLPIRLSSSQQESLNVDAVSGKSINAIRFFNGLGILIWGARTLDGNSQDWRYISVRRTVTFLEQSIKLAARAFVFQPNNANTWSSIKGSVTGFLNSVWEAGGLQGASAGDAFQINIGLGATMTPEDLLNGLMKMTIKVAIVHPAEFIEITFEQKMATSG